MTSATSDEHRPRSRSQHLIEEMLQERKHMLVLLWELSTADLRDVDASTRATLEDFLDTLVDYIAAGQFGLYQRIVDGSERRQPVIATAKEIYGRIARTRDIAVDFSERYSGADETAIGPGLAADLSVLAEEITTRIELEDQLILAMLGGDYIIPRVHG